MTLGSSIGPYRILRQLGSGGMGEVWLAEDSRLQRQVALKAVRSADSDGTSKVRLLREARAAAALNHPNIAAVYDVLEEHGDIVVVFEYVEGETLHARIARGVIPAPEAVEIASQIAKALISAHAHGIVHRDLKPANVIVSDEGHVKVLDFGIARVLAIGTTLTIGGATPNTVGGFGLIGTASYAAPEQMVTSAVDERADLYALGVVLFEMISGHRPFHSNDPIQLATSKLGTAAPKLSSNTQLIPPALETLVASLLERDRERRPASAGDVLATLRSIYGTQTTGTLFGKRPRSMIVAVAAAGLLIALLGGYAVWTLKDVTPPGATANSASPVIAVLPLTNMSGDASKDFIAAGIAESLISNLAALPSVIVLSRASVTEARDRSKDDAALTKDLGATYLVEGSVQQSGVKLRISLNLVRPDRSVAWGDSIEGEFQNIFEMQSRLAGLLTNALAVRVSTSDRARMNAPPTSNAEALSAYWRGQALLERRDVKGNLDGSIAAFTEAIARDNRFALAHAALGSAYWIKYLETSAPEWPEKAVEEGTTALRIDPDLPEVRYTLAVTLAGRGRTDEAIDELNRALAMRPNYDDARRQLGQVLGKQGRIDESVAEYQKALALRPNAASTYSSMGLILYGAGRFDEAARAFTKVTELQPDNSIAFQQLGTAYHQLGKKDLALANYERSTAIRPTPTALSNIGTLYHGRGEFAKAVEAYRAAIALRPNAAVTHRNLGDSLTRLGRREEAHAAYLRSAELSEADLKVNPKDARLAAISAVHLQKAGDVQRARTRIQDALARAPKDIEVLYRNAVIAELTGQPEEALKFLQMAIAGGYSKTRAGEDDDLAPLRNTSLFKQLVGSDTP